MIRTDGRDILHRCLGMGLILAGVLKWLGRQDGGTPVAEVLHGVVPIVELLLGLWLVSGIRKQWSHPLLYGLIAVFFGVAFGKMIRGEDSCGCFGDMSVAPWIMVLFDGLVLLLLFWLRFEKPLFPRVVSSIALCGLLAGTGWLITLVTDPALSDPRPTVVLEYQNWLGKPFPYMDRLSPGNRMANGRWVVLFYRSDCPKCQEARSTFDEWAEKAKAESFDLRFAHVELSTQLDSSIRWVGEVPKILVMEEGFVLGVHSHPEEAGEVLISDRRAVAESSLLGN